MAAGALPPTNMKHLSQALLRMHREGELSLHQLRTWRDEALTKIGENSGATIISASGGGTSFTAAAGLRWDAWLAVLDSVIRAASRNVKLCGSARGRIL